MKICDSFTGRIIAVMLLFAVLAHGVFALETVEWFSSLNQLDGMIRYTTSFAPEWINTEESFIGGTTGEAADLFYARLSIPEDFKFVSSDGYVLGDEACVGSVFQLQRGVNKGEFWQDGGDVDSPPIYWVDDVRKLVYNLVKRKKGIIDKSDNPYYDVYPRTPFKKLFNAPFWQFDGMGDSTATIVTSKEQQEDFRKYIREMGYIKFSDDLSGAQYSYVVDEDAPLYSLGVSEQKKILITKSGSKIGSMRLYTANYSQPTSDTTFISQNNTYGMVAAVEAEGQDIAYWPIFSNYDVYVEDAVRKNGDIDPVSGIPIYRFYNWNQFTRLSYYVDVGVACSIKEQNFSTHGLSGTESTQYSLTTKGLVEYNASYDVECTYYFYGIALDDFRGSTPYYNSIEMPSIRYSTFSSFVGTNANDLFRIGSINLTKKINVVDPAKPKVAVSVSGADNIRFGESNTLRVLMKNTGDVNVSLKSVNSRPVGKIVSCDFDVLSPGKEGECLFSVAPRLGEGVYVQFSYNYKSCGKSQVGLESKTLVESKVLEPVLSEQVYSMGVHGGCENSYYACNEAKTQPSLFAGYKCYKTSNGFFTPTSERFVLKFDLSSLSKGLDVSGARLNLYSNAIGKPQSVGVYSVDMDWKAVQCVPGGDICARPYCVECASLYGLDGVLLSTADVSSPGQQISLDLSSRVKDAYSKGDKYVSVQLRGAEGVWEKEGESSCSVADGWDQRDAVFSGGAQGPYLEIIYR